MNYRNKLNAYIQESHRSLTQPTFAGWKSGVILLIREIDEVHGTNYEDQFRAVCGTKVHEIGPARNFLTKLHNIIR